MKNSTRAKTVLPFRPDLTPCPGDTFALPEMSDVPVEAVIVDRDPADVRRVKIVVADDYPQIGSRDVELFLDEPGRVANIRCDLGAWLDVSRFDVKQRTGTLPPASLKEIRRKREAIASGEVRASLHEEEVDGDPDYRRWKDDTLGGVLAALDRPRQPAGRPVPWRSIAAAMALVFTGFWSFRQMDLLQSEIDRQGQAMARLEASRTELVEKLTESDEEAARLRNENRGLTGQVAELSPDAVQPNQPFAFLNFNGEDRGEHTLHVQEGAGRVSFLVEVVDPEPYEHYGLRIIDKATGEEVWSHQHMELRGGSLLSVGLPASKLPYGDYWLLISGYLHDESPPKKLDDIYLLHVKRPGER